MTEKARSFADMMVQVIQSKRISNYELEVAAEVIAADARFQIWFLDHVKGKPNTAGRTLQLIDAEEELLGQCAQAVDAFINGGDREALRSSLWAIQKKLNQLRD